MIFQIPASLRAGHESLHTALLRAEKEPGALGAAATVLSHALHPHMLREEGLAFTNLGLLRQLAAGVANPEMAPAVEAAAKLQAELAHLAEDHRNITAAVQLVLSAAREVDKTEYAELAYGLLEHLRLEEEVLYPAAILVGEVVRARLGLP